MPDPYRSDDDYHDDVSSLLAQLRDAENVLASIRANLLPLVAVCDHTTTTFGDAERDADRYPLDDGNTADAWDRPYLADQVAKLARSTASAQRDAELIHGRYAATIEAQEGDR